MDKACRMHTFLEGLVGIKGVRPVLFSIVFRHRSQRVTSESTTNAVAQSNPYPDEE